MHINIIQYTSRHKIIVASLFFKWQRRLSGKDKWQKPAKVSWENPWRMGQSQIAEHNRRKGEKEQKAGDLSCPCFAYVLAQLGPFMGKSRYGLLLCFLEKCLLSVSFIILCFCAMWCQFFFQIAFAVRFLLQVYRGKYSIVFGIRIVFSSVLFWVSLLCVQCSLSSKFATYRAARVHSDSAEIRPSEPDQGYLEAIPDVSMNGGGIV